jgi:hypothetical protein
MIEFEVPTAESPFRLACAVLLHLSKRGNWSTAKKTFGRDAHKEDNMAPSVGLADKLPLGSTPLDKSTSSGPTFGKASGGQG